MAAWVSVDVWLPEPYNDVLVMAVNQDKTYKNILIGYQKEEDDDWYFYIPDGELCSLDNIEIEVPSIKQLKLIVTHWTLLPEFPRIYSKSLQENYET